MNPVNKWGAVSSRTPQNSWNALRPFRDKISRNTSALLCGEEIPTRSFSSGLEIMPLRTNFGIMRSKSSSFTSWLLWRSRSLPTPPWPAMFVNLARTGEWFQIQYFGELQLTFYSFVWTYSALSFQCTFLNMFAKRLINYITSRWASTKKTKVSKLVVLSPSNHQFASYRAPSTGKTRVGILLPAKTRVCRCFEFGEKQYVNTPWWLRTLLDNCFLSGTYQTQGSGECSDPVVSYRCVVLITPSKWRKWGTCSEVTERVVCIRFYYDTQWNMHVYVLRGRCFSFSSNCYLIIV